MKFDKSLRKDLLEYFYSQRSKPFSFFKFLLSYLWKVVYLVFFAYAMQQLFTLIVSFSSLVDLIRFIFLLVIFLMMLFVVNFYFDTSENSEHILFFTNSVVALVFALFFIGQDLQSSLITFLSEHDVLKKFLVDTDLISVWIPIIYIYCNALTLYRKVTGPISSPKFTHSLSDHFPELYAQDTKSIDDINEQTKILVDINELIRKRNLETVLDDALLQLKNGSIEIDQVDQYILDKIKTEKS